MVKTFRRYTVSSQRTNELAVVKGESSSFGTSEDRLVNQTPIRHFTPRSSARGMAGFCLRISRERRDRSSDARAPFQAHRFKAERSLEKALASGRRPTRGCTGREPLRYRLPSSILLRVA